LTKSPRNMCQQGLSWNIAITDLKRKTVDLLISIFVTVHGFRIQGSGIMEQAHADFNNKVLALSNLQIAPEGTLPVHTAK